jgi:hypothetical protein
MLEHEDFILNISGAFLTLIVWMIFLLIQLKGFPFYWRQKSEYNYYKLLLYRTYNRIGEVLVSMYDYGQMGIRIRRIRMFLGLLDPDPLVRGTAPDPATDPDHQAKIL